MDDKQSGKDLLLQDLEIENFRGIEKLSLSRMGRVTLFAGENGVGKTTVLEAVRVYAARARYAVLAGLLNDREEYSVATDDEGDRLSEPDWESLFYGRDSIKQVRVSIGPTKPQDQLSLEKIDLVELSEEELSSQGRLFPETLLEGGTHVLKATFRKDSWIVPAFLFRDQHASAIVRESRSRIREVGYRFRREESRLPRTTTCEEIGPGLVSNNTLARFWDNVALTNGEEQATRALGLIYGADAGRVAVVGDNRSDSRRLGRRAIIKLKSNERPVPLKSLGDGALRLFSVALALANSRDGFLLIDEAENRIHHSVQRDYWRMILQMAHENNVQVIASTHSLDCVRGFTWAAEELDVAEGVLVRLERENGALRPVTYSERRLRIAAEQGIEVR